MSVGKRCREEVDSSEPLGTLATPLASLPTSPQKQNPSVALLELNSSGVSTEDCVFEKSPPLHSIDDKCREDIVKMLTEIRADWDGYPHIMEYGEYTDEDLELWRTKLKVYLLLYRSCPKFVFWSCRKRICKWFVDSMMKLWCCTEVARDTSTSIMGDTIESLAKHRRMFATVSRTRKKPTGSISMVGTKWRRRDWQRYCSRKMLFSFGLF